MDVNGMSISIPRGDSGWCEFPMYLQREEGKDPEYYELKEGDRAIFAVRACETDPEPLIHEVLDGYALHLKPSHTEGLEIGKYYYDCCVEFANGDRLTYIEWQSFKVKREAHT